MCEMVDKKKYFMLRASFTVEASLIVPLVVIIIVLGIHLAMDQQEEVTTWAKKAPLVEQLDPVKAMYEKYELETVE